MATAHITRRLFLRAVPPSIAVAGTVAVPSIVMAAQPETVEARTTRAWQEFCAALEDIAPHDCRVQVFGSHVHGRQHPSIRIEFMREQMEKVHPRVTIPVERSIGTVYVNAGGWDFRDAGEALP